MLIAFTICSNNYLAHAKTLGDSFLDNHPDSLFIIGLVDKFNTDFNYEYFSRFIIIPVEELNIRCFSELNSKYNIVELNTAVKPSYIKFIFQKYKPVKLLYLDPDILVVSRFVEVIDLLDNYNIILTPHICSPIDDEYAPTDFHTLRGGIFNLGFIGLSSYEAILDFIDWWHDRVITYGFADFTRSMFYDQLWINYVPVFYNNYFILKHPGYNMANWNLHERYLSDKIFVNQKHPLRFFHFSGYKFKKPLAISSYNTRFNLSDRIDLKWIFEEYQNLLFKNKVDILFQLSVFYYPDLSKKKNKTKNYNFFIATIEKVSNRITKAFKLLLYGKI